MHPDSTWRTAHDAGYFFRTIAFLPPEKKTGPLSRSQTVQELLANGFTQTVLCWVRANCRIIRRRSVKKIHEPPALFKPVQALPVKYGKSPALEVLVFVNPIPVPEHLNHHILAGILGLSPAAHQAQSKRHKFSSIIFQKL